MLISHFDPYVRYYVSPKCGQKSALLVIPGSTLWSLMMEINYNLPDREESPCPLPENKQIIIIKYLSEQSRSVETVMP